MPTFIIFVIFAAVVFNFVKKASDAEKAKEAERKKQQMLQQQKAQQAKQNPQAQGTSATPQRQSYSQQAKAEASKASAELAAGNRNLDKSILSKQAAVKAKMAEAEQDDDFSKQADLIRQQKDLELQQKRASYKPSTPQSMAHSKHTPNEKAISSSLKEKNPNVGNTKAKIIPSIVLNAEEPEEIDCHVCEDEDMGGFERMLQSIEFENSAVAEVGKIIILGDILGRPVAKR